VSAAVTPDPEAVEQRLWALLERYRSTLVPGSVYGVETLTRPGAKAHGYFAGVSRRPGHASLHLMPIYHDPALLDGMSPGLRRRVTGKATLGFAVVDEALFAELAGLLERAFAAYMASGE
jgi:hypothetical protein